MEPLFHEAKKLVDRIGKFQKLKILEHFHTDPLW